MGLKEWVSNHMDSAINGPTNQGRREFGPQLARFSMTFGAGAFVEHYMDGAYHPALINVVNALKAMGFKGNQIKYMVENGRPFPESIETTDEVTDVPIESTPHPESDIETFYNLFSDDRANEEAQKLGISAGSFFELPVEIFPKLHALVEADSLLPIFPPSVMRWKKQIERISKKAGMSPNILATIVTIESQGIEWAGSYAGAIGLTQLMPDKFSDSMDYKDRIDPEINLTLGANYFTNTAYNQAKQVFSGQLPVDDVRVIARAGMAYNAGWYGASLTLEELEANPGYFQTRLYRDHIIRFAMVAEIANNLKNRGLSDSEIVKALVSVEFDARARVLGQVMTSSLEKNVWGYPRYAETMSALNREIISSGQYVGEQNVSQVYEGYKSNPYWSMPLNPANRMYFEGGGEGLFKLYPGNYNLDEWLR